MTQTWHADADDLRRVRAGGSTTRSSPPRSRPTCSAATSAVAALARAPTAAGSDVERRWDAWPTVDRQAPRPAPLLRLGVATRPLRAAWLLAALLVLAGAGGPRARHRPRGCRRCCWRSPRSRPASPWCWPTGPAPTRPARWPWPPRRPGSGSSRRGPCWSRLVAAPLGVGRRPAARTAPRRSRSAGCCPGLALSSLVLLAGTTRARPGPGGRRPWASPGPLAVGMPAATPPRLRRRRHRHRRRRARSSSPPWRSRVAALALTVSRREHVAYRRHA